MRDRHLFWHGAELLDAVCEYRALTCRGAQVAAPARGGGDGRLHALERALLEAPPTRRRHRRARLSLKAALGTRLGPAPADLANLSAGGAMVCGRWVGVTRGMRTIMRIMDPDLGRAYLLAARVAWERRGAVGLAFTGAPRWERPARLEIADLAIEGAAWDLGDGRVFFRAGVLPAVGERGRLVCPDSGGRPVEPVEIERVHAPSHALGAGLLLVPAPERRR